MVGVGKQISDRLGMGKPIRTGKIHIADSCSPFYPMFLGFFSLPWLSDFTERPEADA